MTVIFPRPVTSEAILDARKRYVESCAERDRFIAALIEQANKHLTPSSMLGGRTYDEQHEAFATADAQCWHLWCAIVDALEDTLAEVAAK